MPETVRMRWIDQCLLVDDPMPLDLMSRLTAMFPKGAIMAPHLARMAEAMNAMGMREDTERLSLTLEPSMRDKVDREHPTLSAGAREWLAVGRHGASSIWLFNHITGAQVDLRFCGVNPNPGDASDLIRVVDMLKLVQGNDSLPPSVGGVSAIWAGLAKAWPTLLTSLREERAGDRAPGTTAMIREIIEANR